MAKNDTPLVPEGRRPEEFMNDVALANYHAAQLEAMPDDHKDRAKQVAATRAAKVAAAITQAAGEAQ